MRCRFIFFPLGITDAERGKYKMWKHFGAQLEQRPELPAPSALPKSGMSGINQAPAELLLFHSITKFCLEQGFFGKKKEMQG